MTAADHANTGLAILRRLIDDGRIVTDDDVEVLRRVLDVYEAVSPLVDPTHAVSQLEWNSVMSRLRFAVSRFEDGAR